jgi:alginate O-acetyltransferase complex protein AlgI
MTFNSFAFAAFLFLVMMLRLAFWRNNTEAFQWILLVASLIFYGWFIPVYLLIILATCVIDFTAGRMLAPDNQSIQTRRVILLGSIVANIGMLAFFKYSDFVLGNLNLAAQTFGYTSPLVPLLGLALPIGISFHTFQGMSYTIDVYRRTLPPTNNFFRFLLFVSFFPQLVAGPIVRAHDFFYQFDRSRVLHWPVFLEGARLIVWGFLLKMVVADNIGICLAGEVGRDNGLWKLMYQAGANSALAWLTAMLFAVQIFADFAGYTNIARGVAYWLGFRLPINFNSPYIARSFSDFWRRWHISLSTWLRDYLYIPLGGNRISKLRTYVNLILVMLLGGLWHGAAWTFVIWGAIHGGALAVERLTGVEKLKSGRGAWVIGTVWFLIVQMTVLVAWVLFRSDSIGHAGMFVSNMFSFNFTPWGSVSAQLADVRTFDLALLVTVPVIGMHLRQAGWELFGIKPPNRIEHALLIGLAFYAVLVLAGTSNEFIYFQF